jgi:Fibronectin type III domain
MIVGVFVLSAALGSILQVSTHPAGATSLLTQFGTSVPVVPDGSGGGDFLEVSCPSATSCIAVGDNNASPTQSIFSFGTDVDGVWTWSNSTDVAADTSQGGELNGVSCPSATICIAVGGDAAAQQQGIISVGTYFQETWTWSTSVVQPDGSGGGSLESVSCPSVSECVAVGSDIGDHSIVSIGTNSGSAWTWTTSTQVPSGNGGLGFLNAVDCVSATSCVAAGGDNTQSIYTVGTYSGSTWGWTSATISSDPSGGGQLNAVSCVSSSSCVAVGQDAAVEGQAIESVGTYSGSSWSWTASSIVASDSSGGGVLYGISCVSSNVCTAVGEDQNDQSTFSTGDVSGSTWSASASTVAPSDDVGDGGFNGVVCSDDVTCVAAGTDGSQAIFDTPLNPIVPAYPLLAPTDSTLGGGLGQVSCPTATSCVAIGSDFDGDPMYSTGTQYGGQWTWTSASFSGPGDTTTGHVTGLSCPSTTTCIAVGYDPDTQAMYSIATLSNGSWSWTPLTFEGPASSVQVLITGVSCVSSTSCLEVGWEITGNQGYPLYASATYSNGAWTWSAMSALTSVQNEAQFSGIACVSATSCVAVGNGYYSNQDEAMSETATFASGTWTWTNQEEIAPGGNNTSYLTSVECPTPTTCLATGSNGDGYGLWTSGTYSQGSWSWTPPSGIGGIGYGDNFGGVSCPTTTYCIAVGDHLPTFYSNQATPAYWTVSNVGGTWTWSSIGEVSNVEGFYNGVSCPTEESCVAVGGSSIDLPIYDAFAPVLATLPGAPTVGSASVNGSAVTLHWSAPTSTNGDTITGYDVLAVDTSASTIESDVCPSSATSTNTSCVVTGLNGADTYTFSVAAVVPQGIGPISNYSNDVTLPATEPSAPTITSSTVGNASVTLAWSAPSEDGGAPVSGYEVNETNVTTSAVNTNVCSGSETSTSLGCTVSGLINGDEYTFTVAAINSVGEGASSPSIDVTPMAPGGGGGGGGGGSGGGGGGGTSGGSGSGSGSGGGGTSPTPPPTSPSPPSEPPIPREVTYSNDTSSLSSKGEAILASLVKKLEKGASLTVTGYAFDDKKLARERATIVAAFIEKRMDVRVTLKEVLTSKVGKVTVVTTKL